MRTIALSLLIGAAFLASGCQRATLVKEHGGYEMKTNSAADDYPSHFDDHRRDSNFDGPSVRPSTIQPPAPVTPDAPAL